MSGTDAADYLSGGKGNDTLLGGKGDDLLDGGAGRDAVSFQDSTAGVTASLLAGAAPVGSFGNDKYISIEGFVGSNYADRLTGDAGDNFIEGGIGNDTLDGGAGADTLVGGAGDDTYVVDNTGDAITENAAE